MLKSVRGEEHFLNASRTIRTRSIEKLNFSCVIVAMWSLCYRFIIYTEVRMVRDTRFSRPHHERTNSKISKLNLGDLIYE